MGADFEKSNAGTPPASHRRKYVTLVFLLIWVAAVFAFTFFKFSGGAR